MILLGIVCNVILGLASNPCDFIIGVVTLLVKMAMATGQSRGEEYDGHQRHILGQLPTSLFTVLNQFKLDSKTTTYAVCPTCSCTFKPAVDRTSATITYPAVCTNRILEASGSQMCCAELLEQRNGHRQPIKPFVAASLTDWLARLLSDAEVEKLCDKACDEAMHASNVPCDPDMTNAFHADFMKTFEGPTPGWLFIDRGDKVRLALVIHTDFFNLHSTRRRGNHDSIGIISIAILNLPESIRYQPEHLFLAGIIPSPQEPDKDALHFYLKPIIDECVVAWKPGIHLSQTALSPKKGRCVDTAIVISVNDLPAARKVSGAAGLKSDFYCTVCSRFGTETMYDTNFGSWRLRDVSEMHQQAEAWRDAQTLLERTAIFTENGVQWSEF
jgi:hypothetical protein